SPSSQFSALQRLHLPGFHLCVIPRRRISVHSTYFFPRHRLQAWADDSTVADAVASVASISPSNSNSLSMAKPYSDRFRSSTSSAFGVWWSRWSSLNCGEMRVSRGKTELLHHADKILWSSTEEGIFSLTASESSSMSRSIESSAAPPPSLVSSPIMKDA